MGKFSQPRDTASASQPSRKASGYAAPSQYSPKPPKKGPNIALISLCAVAVVLVIAVIVCVWFFIGGGADDGLILQNVSAGGIDLSGMSKKEAKTALHSATDLTYSQQSMVVELPDATLEFSPADTGALLNVDAVVEEAYSYGRTGTKAEREQVRANAANTDRPIALLPYLTLDLDYIRGQLEEYGSTYNSEYAPSSATLEGEMPELNVSSENFDPNAQGQTLVIELGNPGHYVDMDSVYDQILDAYSFNNFLLSIDPTEADSVPDAIDLEALYEEYYVEPVDAAMDTETFDVTPEIYGYGFDLEAAKAQLEEADYGDTIQIPLTLIQPAVIGEELSGLLFRDVLASYQTSHTNDKNRNTNLTLACEAINGVVLQPGDTFDYNTTLGKRTAEKGYKAASAYSGGLTVQSIGGGICQVSSTLYYCTLIADLEIVSRTPHSYVSSYMPMGMDATVSWGGPEFRFKNSTNYPIRIEAEVSDGYVKVQLIGTDEKDYYIEMEYEVISTVKPTTETVEILASDNPNNYYNGQVIATAYTGYTVKTYKCKYDKETKELISRDYDKTSTYKYRNKQIASIVTSLSGTTATTPTTEPTTPSTEATTPVETTAPTEAPVTPTEAPAAPPEAPPSDSGVSEG